MVQSGFQVAVAVAATRVTFEETVGVAAELELEEARAAEEESEGEREGGRESLRSANLVSEVSSLEFDLSSTKRIQQR